MREDQTESQVAAYGTWSSPISSTSAVAQTVVIAYMFVDSVTHEVYHIEQRPAERGRSVIVHSRSSTDVFEQGSSWNARSAVHEYGGAAAAAYDGVIYFSHIDDGRLYQFSVAVREATIVNVGSPSPVTPMDDRKRYASPTPHPTKRHLLVAVQEDHTHDTPSRVDNSLVCIDTRTPTMYPLIIDADFYAAPTFSPDGTKLAWQAWNHPHMPWVGTTIWVADLTFQMSSIQAMNYVCIASSMSSQPTHPGSGVSYVSWLDDDTLLFLAEASGWRNPWVYSLSSQNAKPVLKVPIQEDFASVYKLLGASYYASLEFAGPKRNDPSQSASDCYDKREMLFVAYRGGRSVLYVVDVAHPGKAEAIELDCPFVDVSCVRSVGRSTDTDSARVMFIASRPDAPSVVTFCSITRLHTGYKASFSSTRAAQVKDLAVPLSLPRPMMLTDDEGEPLYVVYYAPSNPAFVAPDGELPPCIVNVHGGPTLVALQSLDWTKQWFTSRGWVWLDVNYRGSSLYGRKYTDRLDGQWGVLDVWDCIRATCVLSSPPYSLVDPARCIIRGLSAGGYTVLSYAAGTFHTGEASPHRSPTQTDFTFKAGVSYFGIADLAALARASHKFESHYVYKLLGGRPDEPGMADVYRRRSPVFHGDKIEMPLLMLQGLADPVVPAEQSKTMVHAIMAHQCADLVKYKTYEGEGHGFSCADTHKSALEEEATWFAQWLGIEIRL